MNPKIIKFIFSLAVVFFLPALLSATSHYDYIYSSQGEIYFGHISYTEVKYDGRDPVVIREGEKTPEVAALLLWPVERNQWAASSKTVLAQKVMK